MRKDKLTKLIAVFDQFYNSMMQLDDPTSKRLIENWNGIRHNYVNPVSASRSALAAGMEQGLREKSLLLQSMHAELRKEAAEALEAAIAENYPEFLAKDADRITKIKTRGAIRSDNEFYLVRHHADLLESNPSQQEELQLLYQLLDRFESRARHA